VRIIPAPTILTSCHQGKTLKHHPGFFLSLKSQDKISFKGVGCSTSC
jgi:hypothetical protein